MGRSTGWMLAAAGVMGVCASAALAGGTVKGKINFDGKMAKAKQVRVAGDPFCVQSHKDKPLFEETYVFNEEKATLCNVLVYVKGSVPGKFEAPSKPAVIDQVGCQYTPHVVGVMKGQQLQLKNSDATAHNLDLKSANNPSFNEGQPVPGMVKTVTFNNIEFDPPMRLKCQVHAWMNAFIAVFDHPFFAVSDENGEFEITDLPPGKYTLKVWHEFDRFTPVQSEIEFEVSDGGSTTVDFTYRPPQ